MLLEVKRIQVAPRQRVLLSEVQWQEFEAILEDLGDRITRENSVRADKENFHLP